MLKALVVEDDETLRHTLVGVLRLWGFDAVGVGSGQKALKLGLFDQTLAKPFPLLALRTCVTASIQQQAKGVRLEALGAPRE